MGYNTVIRFLVLALLWFLKGCSQLAHLFATANNEGRVLEEDPW